MKRVFVALALPEGLRRRVASLAAGIEGARWTAPENLHVTLRFVGEVPEDRIADLAGALGGVRAPALRVGLRGTGCFGAGPRARSVWVGVERTAEIVALRDKVERAVAGCGHGPDGRRFTPHVTVGRLRRSPEGHVRAWLEGTAAFAAPPFECGGFALYESRLGRPGPAYRPLAEFGLVGGAG